MEILTPFLLFERVFVLANVLEGELVVSVTGAEMMNSTILNRIDLGWCTDYLDCAQRAYWGFAPQRIPQNKFIELAIQALNSGKRYTKIVFAFSQADLNRLGLKAGALSDNGIFFLTNEEASGASW